MQMQAPPPIPKYLLHNVRPRNSQKRNAKSQKKKRTVNATISKEKKMRDFDVDMSNIALKQATSLHLFSDSFDGVPNIQELRRILADHSRTFLESDQNPQSPFFPWRNKFKGLIPLPIFIPHKKYPDSDINRHHISKYYRCAVRDEEHIKAANEYALPKLPSTILQSEASIRGALYLGGFSSAMNKSFIKKASILGIVNCARGLDISPYFAKRRDEILELGVSFLNLELVDSVSQRLDQDKLKDAISFIENSRRKNIKENKFASVLVHCAAGRSRSSAIVVAYLTCAKQISVHEALEIVQKNRSIAQPNRSFMEQLIAYEKKGIFQEIWQAIKCQ